MLASSDRQYTETEKSETFLDEKNVKITKLSHAFKGYASSNNVTILNSFNPELQLKDTSFTIKNKLIDLLRGFNFLTLVSKFKRIESNDETKCRFFYSNSKAQTLLMKVILMVYLNRLILRLYQTYKRLRQSFNW